MDEMGRHRMRLVLCDEGRRFRTAYEGAWQRALAQAMMRTLDDTFGRCVG
jgi:hypothetical protein